MLITRLLLVAVIVSIVFAGLVVHNERARLFKVATDRVVVATGVLTLLMREQLDAPGLGDHEEIRKMLKLGASKGAHLSTGHYVFARIFDPRFHEVARVVDTNAEQIEAVVGHARSEQLRPPAGNGEPEMTTTRLGGREYIRALVPLVNSRGVVAAYIEGFFAPTREERGETLRNLVRAAGIAVGTVFATSLLLYPVIIRLMRRLARLSHNLLDSNLETLRVIGSTIAKRDSDTDVHNFRVTIYSVKVAEALGLDDQSIRILIKGAFLHDVGKIGIRDNILLKPGRLDEKEFAEMKKHVGHGIDIVSRSSWLREASSVVGSHHEKYEGNGYPNGLKGGDIPVLARIFAIADVFDALTSHRPYKNALGFDETIDILMEGRGSHFDPEVLDAFVTIARALYDLYANRDDERVRRDLEEITERYYKADIATFLE